MYSPVAGDFWMKEDAGLWCGIVLWLLTEDNVVKRNDLLVIFLKTPSSI